MTIHRVCNYQGGDLSIKGHIYGSPDVRWQLFERGYHGKRLIAESIDKAEIETLEFQITAAFNLINPKS